VRWSRRRLRDSDRALLSDLAGQLGSVVHAESLHLVVKSNQERLVLAREEERKRLRRDLHDGLGPALAGLMLRVDTLRNQLRLPEHQGLLQLRADIQATLVDVRRIVEGLRPPALDELGLPGALDQLAGRLSQDGRLAIEVSVTGRALPAAVEVAAYRIVQEALTNTVRHANAAHVSVSLQASDGALDVSVADDGVGTQEPRVDGIGLRSMRERAEEIGGSLRCEPVAGKGTTVIARLPFAAAPQPRVPS
jgi:signal transduction histidine kinase